MYDAIVVGARVGGASTALLLARQGYRTLLVDRALFPSDTLSTHFIQSSGIALLARWGLLDRLRATGCPSIKRNRLNFGSFSIEGTPPSADGGITEFYAPRRSVLDQLLIDAAVEAGVEFRPESTVEGIAHTGSKVIGIRGRHRGALFEETARVTIGADGRHSLIARLVAAPEYDRHPSITCFHYAYWKDLPTDALEVWIRPEFTLMVAPTNEGLSIGVMVFPISEFPRVRLDVEGTFHEVVQTIPEIAKRFAGAKRQSQFFGTADLPNFYRRPYGEGWALVGDAGYHRDPYTAQGITDAFRHADLLASALDEGLRNIRPLAACLQDYEAIRNESTRSLYALTRAMASHEPPPPDTSRILAALPGNQEQANRFLGVFAGTVRYEDFFASENVAEILQSSTVPAKSCAISRPVGAIND